MWGSAVQGWATIVILVAFIGGLILLSLGIISEYLWRILDETRRRPNFVIDRVIEKGKPFNPDKRMKAILTDAIAIANAASRSIVWHPRTEGNMKGIRVYPDTGSAWIMAWVDKNCFFNGKDGHTLNSDARVMFHYPYTAVTPAMALTVAGAGSDYGIAFVDSKKLPFDGDKTYKLHLPPNPPAKDFWALTMYDNQTRSMLQTSQTLPSRGSQSEGLKKNADGSYDSSTRPATAGPSAYPKLVAPPAATARRPVRSMAASRPTW